MQDRPGAHGRAESVHPGSRPLAWALCAAFIVIAAGAWTFWILNWRAGTAESDVRSDLPMFLVFTLLVVLGALVAHRQPRNLIGWLLLWVALGAVVGFFSANYAIYAQRTNPAAPAEAWFAWISEWVWTLGVIPLPTLFVLLFPNGRLPTPRWRPLAWATIAGTGVAALAGMLAGGTYEDSGVANPLPFTVPQETAEAVTGGAFIFVTVCAVGCLLSLVVRFRRSRGEERLQLKWITYAVTFLILSLVLDTTYSAITQADDTPGWLDTLNAIGFLLLPASAGIAILKYRLFDIDVVINRTLVYGASSAVLAGLYFGSVVLLQGVLGDIGGGSQLSVAASTLAVAAAFNPVRERLQRFIDRRFYRRKYDARQTVEEFAAALRQEVSLDSLSAHMIDVVHKTLQPRNASLWLPSPSQAGEAGARPPT